MRGCRSGTQSAGAGNAGGTISSEITSTLNLDRVLQTIVNGPQSVIPFQRSAIALEQDGQLRLRADSGCAKSIRRRVVIQLRDLMERLSLSQEVLSSRNTKTK